MDIVQLTPVISYGDAISNQVIAMDKMFKSFGMQSVVYAGKIDPKLEYNVLPFHELDQEKEKNIIFHFSSGTSMVNDILRFPGKVMLCYHNITPAKYFFGISWGAYRATRKGRKQLIELKEKTRFAWAVSEYNRLELEAAGYQNTAVLPIIVDFSALENMKDNTSVSNRFKDGKMNLLFVGRIAPNKKHEDLIRILYYYKHFIDSKVRLLLVGSQKLAYLKGLEQLIASLDLQDDIVFTGKVSNEELHSYYKTADAFICMSEHEGFCVPLLEAMFHQLPIFAYESTAIPYTLGESGVMFDSKDYSYISETIRYVMNNFEIKQQILEAQKKRLREFRIDVIKENALKDIEKFFYK